jgi:hypothetical protein
LRCIKNNISRLARGITRPAHAVYKKVHAVRVHFQI